MIHTTISRLLRRGRLLRRYLRSRYPRPAEASQGWILLEVMVAVMIAGILLGPLATAVMSAVGQAAHVRRQADGLVAHSLDTESMDAWIWGGQVIAGEWSAGPALEVRVRFPSGAGDPSMVGVWVDGWFRGEWPVDPSGVLTIEATTWSAGEGSEVVLRVRAPGASWGPPWRSLVPGFDGRPVAASSTGTPESGSAKTVIHPPAVGNPALEISWEGARSIPALLLPLVFEGPGAGPVSASIEGSAQTWLMENRRALDVYF
ncbi:MAG: type II secretion system protein [Thermoleophilia bacterium]|jgi:hypothetical protein